jgi:hypothetical protein
MTAWISYGKMGDSLYSAGILEQSWGRNLVGIGLSVALCPGKYIS